MLLFKNWELKPLVDKNQMKIGSMNTDIHVFFRWGDRIEFFRKITNIEKRKRIITRTTCRFIKCILSSSIQMGVWTNIPRNRQANKIE